MKRNRSKKTSITYTPCAYIACDQTLMDAAGEFAFAFGEPKNLGVWINPETVIDDLDNREASLTVHEKLLLTSLKSLRKTTGDACYYPE